MKSRNRRLVWDPESKRTALVVAVLLAGLVVIGSWLEVGFSALGADGPISAKGIVACLAFAMAGIGAGVLLAGVTVRRARRRGRVVPEPGAENMDLFCLLMGLASVGSGMEYALEPAPPGWALLSLWFFSTGGGALLGSALVLNGRGRTGRVSGGGPGIDTSVHRPAG